MVARLAAAGASPAAVAKTTFVPSGDQSGWVALRPPRLKSAPTFIPVTRSTIHIFPPQATTTLASSGEMVANPWPPVFATDFTSGVGGAALVTSVIQRLPPELALTGAARYLP